jgi:hypothetical protein
MYADGVGGAQALLAQAAAAAKGLQAADQVSNNAVTPANIYRLSNVSAYDRRRKTGRTVNILSTCPLTLSAQRSHTAHHHMCIP